MVRDIPVRVIVEGGEQDVRSVQSILREVRRDRNDIYEPRGYTDCYPDMVMRLIFKLKEAYPCPDEDW